MGRLEEELDDETEGANATLDVGKGSKVSIPFAVRIRFGGANRIRVLAGGTVAAVLGLLANYDRGKTRGTTPTTNVEVTGSFGSASTDGGNSDNSGISQTTCEFKHFPDASEVVLTAGTDGGTDAAGSAEVGGMGGAQGTGGTGTGDLEAVNGGAGGTGSGVSGSGGGDFMGIGGAGGSANTPDLTELCLPTSFSADQKIVYSSVPGENPCDYFTINGQPWVHGNIIVNPKDKDKFPITCHVIPVWARNSSVRAAGRYTRTVETDPKTGKPIVREGKITLVDGKACLTIIGEHPEVETELTIPGQATAHITTDGQALVEYVGKHIFEQYGGIELEAVRVIATFGKTTIRQKGREKPIILNPGDPTMNHDVFLPTETMKDVQNGDQSWSCDCNVVSSNTDMDIGKIPGVVILIAGMALIIARGRREDRKRSIHGSSSEKQAR